MTDTFLYAQLQPFTLSGAGTSIGDVVMLLSSFKTIDGVNLAMTDFGTIGFGTIEPNNGAQEEQISFSGLTQNSDGTCTLSGVKTVLFKSPYTQTAGLAKTHIGGTKFVITNTAGFYDKFVSKDNDETINGLITFAQNPVGINPGGTADATTIVKGITMLSATPTIATSPIALGTNDGRIPTTDEKAALAGTSTPSVSNKYVTEDNAGLSNNVKLSGDQTVAGVKTFTSIPVISLGATPSTSTQLVPKWYVDSLASVLTNQTISVEGSTVTYSKYGKLYYDLTVNISGIKPIGCESNQTLTNTANRIASALGKTVNTFYQPQIQQVSNNTYFLQSATWTQQLTPTQNLLAILVN